MADQLRYDGQVVVVTGAGGGLGKAYALFYGSRGASVVINDLGGSFKGEGNSTRAADVVVDEIKAAGGKAVANYDSVEFGDKIIATAIQAFGRIDVLINNAGILRDVSFKNITDQDWDLIVKVHITGAYKCTRAAWPYFRKQRYGRVINTASAAGLYGNFGQTNYSAAKLALVGFTETLAKEGAKYNILSNVIAPIAASRLTETVLPPDVLKALNPDFVVPLVAVLTHSSNKSENGGIYEVGGGFAAKTRWQRSNGLLLKADDSYTANAILNKWDQVVSFDKNSQYPSGPNDFLGLLEESLRLGPSEQGKGKQPDFTGKVALVTGGGAGIGRAYCLAFAKYGASVVVNDLVNPDTVVSEIKKLGGKAAGVKGSVEDGDALVKGAIAAFGRLDILVNNAGILHDKSFANMDDKQWHSIINVHLRGTYKVTKAAWPFFLKQKYGRVINTTSTSGIYGNFGQANYAAAKCGILGFSRALALEGAKHNIFVNTIAPNAGTALTATVMPKEMVDAFRPEYIAPLILALSGDDCPDPTGGLYEVGSGWIGKTRWEQSGGAFFPVDAPLTPEALLKRWEEIVSFDSNRVSNPERTSDSIGKIMSSLDSRSSGQAQAPAASNQYLDGIKNALGKTGSPVEFNYTERDSILYNIGVGAKVSELKYVFEGAEEFQVLPTFGVIPLFTSDLPFGYDDIIPNFNPMMLLHGEQYLEIRKYPVPTSTRLLNRGELIEVVDKGSAAVVKTGVTSVDAETGEDIFYNEMTAFVRGSGGFDGPRKPSDRGAATAANTPPARGPDSVVEFHVPVDQAAIYRLSGDYNPLHVDPAFAKMGGFKAPILHGLCSFGIAGKAIYDKYGPFRNIKVRFAGTVNPGQTIVTEMWREGNKVIFQSKVKETGKLAIASAAAELVGNASSKI